MDLTKILAELRQELAHVNAAILSLEQLQKGARRRGRPPRWMTEIRQAEAPAETSGKTAGRRQRLAG